MKNLLFLIGRVRSKEKNLLKESDWQRFNDAGDLAAWLSMLKDSAYAEAAAAPSFEHFESMLNNYFGSLKQDLFSAQRFPFESLLWKKYDLHNIKILLKMYIGHKDLRNYLVPLGELSTDLLEAFLLKNEKVNLPLATIHLLNTAKEVFEKNKSFAEMDTYLDQNYFKEILQESKSWGKEAVLFYKRQIDVANFKLWWYHRKNEKTRVSFIAGGLIEPRFFETASDMSAEQMVAKLLPGLKIEKFEEALLQKEVDDLISEQLYIKRYSNQGILPVLVFFRAIEMDIKNLKTFYLRQARSVKRLSQYMRKAYA